MLLAWSTCLQAPCSTPYASVVVRDYGLRTPSMGCRTAALRLTHLLCSALPHCMQAPRSAQLAPAQTSPMGDQVEVARPCGCQCELEHESAGMGGRRGACTDNKPGANCPLSALCAYGMHGSDHHTVMTAPVEVREG